MSYAYPSIPTLDARTVVADDAEVEAVAQAVYVDARRLAYQTGATPDLWAKITEEQRQWCRFQARAAIHAMRALEAGRRQ